MKSGKSIGRTGYRITLEGQGDGLLQLLQLFCKGEVSLCCRGRVGIDVPLSKSAWARHDFSWGTIQFMDQFVGDWRGNEVTLGVECLLKSYYLLSKVITLRSFRALRAPEPRRGASHIRAPRLL